MPARLDALGTVLREGYNALAEELGVLPFTRCVGFGCRTMVTFAPQGTAAGADPLHMKSFVQQELIRRGDPLERLPQPVGRAHARGHRADAGDVP